MSARRWRVLDEYDGHQDVQDRRVEVPLPLLGQPQRVVRWIQRPLGLEDQCASFLESSARTRSR